MVATASTEHSYWLALAFLADFVYATHTTQAIAFEWKPGVTPAAAVISQSQLQPASCSLRYQLPRLRLKFDYLYSS